MAPEFLTPAKIKMPFDIVLRMPGSKSHANRAIIAACLCEQRTIIKGIDPCRDVMLMIENLQQMGFKIKWQDQKAGILDVFGGRPVTAKTGNDVTLYCENAGTTLRFLTALACIVPGKWKITGNEYMLRRPIGDLTDTLKQLGANIKDTEGYPPLYAAGSLLKPNTISLDASKSSQYLTSVLLLAPAINGPVNVKMPTIPTSRSYLDLTKKVLNDFGVELNRSQQTYTVPDQHYRSPGEYGIEGDWSAAGALLVLAELTHSHIDFSNLKTDSVQGDSRIPEIIKLMKTPGNITIDCTPFPDQVMNLAVLAAFKKGTTTLKGAANLRLKECDRLAITVKEFSKLGIDIKEFDDGLIVSGFNRKKETKEIVLNPHDDHRMAMAFAVLGSVIPNIKISNPGCVSKSYPDFWKDLEKINNSPKSIAVVGMRGAGKTVLARRLAGKLKLKFLDVDQIIENLHGPIDKIVLNKGWPTFRLYEEGVITECLKPASVVSLGGGAIESPTTRKLLKEKAIVIWLQADINKIMQHLHASKAKRPKLTSLSLTEELKFKLKQRNPLYSEVADIAVPANLPYGKQIAFLTEEIFKLCSL